MLIKVSRWTDEGLQDLSDLLLESEDGISWSDARGMGEAVDLSTVFAVSAGGALRVTVLEGDSNPWELAAHLPLREDCFVGCPEKRLMQSGDEAIDLLALHGALPVVINGVLWALFYGTEYPFGDLFWAPSLEPSSTPWMPEIATRRRIAYVQLFESDSMVSSGLGYEVDEIDAEHVLFTVEDYDDGFQRRVFERNGLSDREVVLAACDFFGNCFAVEVLGLVLASGGEIETTERQLRPDDVEASETLEISAGFLGQL